MEVQWIRWSLALLCACLSVAQPDEAGRVRRFTYVVQQRRQQPPGQSGFSSPMLSRTYSVSSTSVQERTRRMSQVGASLQLHQHGAAGAGGGSSHQSVGHGAPRGKVQQEARSSTHVQHKHQQQGVNVCGGQCCQGWSKAPGSERCTKPNCTPACQNGGMCLRPQFCICKPGTKGKACETTATSDTSSTSVSRGQVLPAQPVPQQSAHQDFLHRVQSTSNNSPVGQMTLTLKQKMPVAIPQQVQPQLMPLSSQALTMNLHQGQTQQFVMKPKYYSNTQKVLLGGEQSTDGLLPLRAGQDHSFSPFQLVNHTGRIKVVFTPSICKVTCTKGNCQNTCEKGNTTTLISENGHAADTLTSTNFRVVICHLPCMNGGQCSARDKCQCPPSFTGKLCQIPVQNTNFQKQYQHPQQANKVTGSHVIHSTHSLPLTVTGQHQGVKVKLPPSMVNIHVKHPPEASVMFHQVSRIDSSSTGHKVNDAQAGHSQVSYHSIPIQNKHQGAHATYPHQQTISHHYPVSAKTQLGRCFQETTGSQCGKALPGLSKQEDCCGTVGTSWGFNKCQKCPKKTTYPNYGQLLECPQGYKRVNATFCQDINECQLQGVCPNGDCLNTMGSYRCTCKQGFVPDPTLSACIQDNVMISEEKGACFRFVSAGKQCMHPLSVQLSKQLCCCSVGKAWGPYCEKCPLLGTAAFKDICPGGMGYTVSGSTRNKVNIHHHPAVRVQPPPNGGRTNTIRPAVRVTVPPLPAKHEPVEALSFPQKNESELPEQEAVATAAPDQHQVPLDDRIRVDSGQPQLSPGISTINLQPERPVVIVKTSPPVPVALGPEVSTSSASQVIAPSQSTEINECRLDPQICGSGYCYDLPDGYTCICDSGFTLNVQGTRCIDQNECAETAHLCSHGRCENTEGSFLCVCQVGFKANEEGTSCIDINECLTPHICGDGLCVNTVGSFRCEYCNQGYRMNRRGQCEDIDECLAPSTCPSDKCINAPGSYKCVPCADGYRGYNGQCLDIDECQDSSLCTNGECSNLEGSFMCTCGSGYEPTHDRRQCQDVDECSSGTLCTNGRCENLEGSFRCTCKQGYKLSSAGDQCKDVDECQQQDGLCREGRCRNTEGSFRCDCKPGYRASAAGDQCEDIDECREEADPCQGGGSCRNTAGSYECTCQEGFELIDGRRCQDINECSLSTLCSPNGECLNTEGFFQCICEAGFSTSADGRSCEDIDECANSTHCGSQGFCENTEGSYRCLCYQGYQDSLDGQGCVDVNECEMLSGVCGEALCENVEGSFMCLCSDENQEYDPMTGHCIFQNSPDQLDDDKKECYYNLNDANFCDNVLTSNITKQECCCTLGAGWGDNCEIFPCPVAGSEEFTAMCPEGKGFIPTLESLYDDVSGPQYEDADECMLFGQEICKNGFCLNTQPGYECYCKQGTYYDPVKLQCFDTDECQDPNSCVNGQCINTDGSYNCFCTRPMVLDTTGTRCIRPAEYTDDVEESEVYQDLCWQHISDDFVCSRPLVGTQTSYSECCCLHGEAWGMQCALCPVKTSEDYATLCNIPVSGPRRPYGRDALVGFEDHYGPETNPHFVQDRYLNSFEELQAEECGILNGCENGRCVRVQEGYTCDCFDGYHLDMAKMKCVDVNECTELNNRMSLCKNAKCINTEGSYRCVCLPGYESSDQPNFCRPLNAAKEDSELE